uniref:Uncharacterized protein n=1 Tax=Anguilla anguilla TaxID=7936 RepID=A0A0E9PD23_ANGAN
MQKAGILNLIKMAA